MWQARKGLSIPCGTKSKYRRTHASSMNGCWIATTLAWHDSPRD